jgi:hypothetical protein
MDRILVTPTPPAQTLSVATVVLVMLAILVMDFRALTKMNVISIHTIAMQTLPVRIRLAASRVSARLDMKAMVPRVQIKMDARPILALLDKPAKTRHPLQLGPLVLRLMDVLIRTAQTSAQLAKTLSVRSRDIHVLAPVQGKCLLLALAVTVLRALSGLVSIRRVFPTI